MLLCRNGFRRPELSEARASFALVSALADDPVPMFGRHPAGAAVAEVSALLAGVGEAPLWSVTDSELTAVARAVRRYRAGAC